MRASRLLFRTACSALLLLSIARPAQSATVTADFDGDGILDTASLARSPGLAQAFTVGRRAAMHVLAGKPTPSDTDMTVQSQRAG